MNENTRGSHDPPETPDGAVRSDEPTLVVALGASAGGLEALQRFFAAVPADTGMAFVVIQHLDPGRESLSAELLGRRTGMPVREVEADPQLVPDQVSVIPPNRRLTIEGSRLHLHELPEHQRSHGTIDLFFRSLATASGERAVGIVLSGTGSDGALGLREIKAHGGLTLVQDPETAGHDGMPRAAIATAAVDHVVRVEEMPELLTAYADHPYVNGSESGDHAVAPDQGDVLPELLAVLKARTRYDFRRYKKNMLARRVERRMGLNQIHDHRSYLELLRRSEDEAEQLFKDLLIGVTQFFREPEAFRVLEEEVAPALVDAKSDDDAIRVWVPACSTGEEAYSIGMVLQERIRAANVDLRLQVFASDIDDDALQTARQGVYPRTISADLTEARLARFFSEEDDRLRVVPALRDAVVFARHNLLTDPPFSKMDLISCRNLLIYLEPEIQSRLLQLFHFALNECGYLMLGGSETVAAHPELYEPVSKKHRMFRRIGITPTGAVDLVGAVPDLRRRHEVGSRSEEGRDRLGATDVARLVHKVLLADRTPPAVLVNRASEVLYFHGDTDRFLRPPMGSPTADLQALARDALGGRIRAAMRRAIELDEEVVIAGARLEELGGSSPIRITVTPVKRSDEVDGLLLVTFEDEPGPATMQLPSEGPSDEPVVRELEHELKTTREELQSVIEELESSNEELKASNEEVMSMNEELQSTNEELETSKEELQSLNEELVTVNNQLQVKIGELEQVNNDLTNLLRSTDIATIFLDDRLCIKRYTEATARLFNLRPSDLGRPLVDLAQKFTDGRLLDDAREVLARLSPVAREVETDDGSWFSRRVLPYRTEDNRIDGVVITFADVTELKRAQRELEAANQRLAASLDRRTAMVNLLHRVSVAANGAASIDEAVTAIVPDVAAHIGARYAQSWLIEEADSDAVRAFGPAWEAAEGCAGEVVDSTPNLRRLDDGTVVQQAVERREPIWSNELDRALGPSRAEAARDAGLRLAMAFPIVVGTEAFGAVELLLDIDEERRVLVSDLVTAVGTEIGRVVERTALQKRLSDLSESEQRRIGQELHDTVAQEIAGVRILAEVLQRQIEDGSAEPEAAARVMEAAATAQEHVRSLARGLVPVAIAAGGFRAAVENLVERIDTEEELECAFRNPDGVTISAGDLATNLYYIAQEAVMNAVEHAACERVTVEIADVDDGLRMRIEDDGSGFDPDRTDQKAGSGLRIMAFRARLIGGRLEISSEPGVGTTVTCVVGRPARTLDLPRWRTGASSAPGDS